MKKADLKGVAVVVAGVFAAGYALYLMRDIELVDNVRRGYGG